MALKVTDDGELRLLTMIQQTLGSSGSTLHLFVNDHVPADADLNAAYTEASFPGYASQALAWAAPTNPAGVAQMTAPAKTWTATGASPQQVYGYMVRTQTGFLLWAERDPNAPINMTVAGNSYTVVPVFTLHSEF